MMKTSMVRIGLLLCLVFVGLAVKAWPQPVRGAIEDADVYEFAPPLEVERRYEHDPKRRERLLNPDFYCTKCAEEGRIDAKHRNDLRSILETTVHYPFAFQGKTSQVFGRFRAMEHDADRVLEVVFEEMRTKDPIYIEDRLFRLITDLDSFHTRKDPYPRREIELAQLADIFPKVSERTTVLNSHQRAHLYLIRAHRVYRDFTHLVQYEPRAKYMDFLGPYLGTREKFEIYIFGEQRQAGEFLNRFLGHSNQLDGECWHTLNDDSMVVVCHGENLRDVWLNNTFTHRLSFNFTQAFRGYHYDLPAWFLVGFSHLMERRERTDMNTFFFGEGTVSGSHWGQSKWKPKIRKMVAKNDLRSLAEYAGSVHVNDLSAAEHGVAWSLVSFQLQQGHDEFGRFLHRLKEKQSGETIEELQQRAFREIYNTTILQFFEDWQDWVMETYPIS